MKLNLAMAITTMILAFCVIALALNNLGAFR